MGSVTRKIAVSGLAVVLVAAAGIGGVLTARVNAARAQMDAYFPVPAAGLTLTDLSDWQIEALLRVEDPGFRDHSGIDLTSPGGGITTITQALVKRTFMHPFRPGPWNKLEQSAIARFAIDPLVTKDQQLETFLNIAYFGEAEGNAVLGFPEAARTYFGMPVADLDRRQYLALVAMLIAPNALLPGRHDTRLNARVDRIEVLLAGDCEPEGLRDVWLEACG